MGSDQDQDQRIATLVSWATSRGAHLHPSVEVYQDPNTGLSFRVKPDTAAPLPAWDVIVSLPTSLSLSYLNALTRAPEDPTGSAVDGDGEKQACFPAEFVTRTPPHVLGRLFLVREFLLGEASFWWPYIQALPQPSDRSSWALPPFWPADEAELLDGTNVEVGLEKIHRDVKRGYDEAAALLELVGGDDGGVLQCALTLDLYHWAYCVFSSRSFRPSLVLDVDDEDKALPSGVSIDDFSVLLPLFDIGNHDMTAAVRWDLERGDNANGGNSTSSNGNGHGAAAGSRCELKVGREFAPSEQVFNNYSMKTNAELLLGYGFMVPPTEALHNDYTHVRKRADAPAASDEYFISRRPMSHPSSLLGRKRQQAEASAAGEEQQEKVDTEGEEQMLGAFRHVQQDMVWDIFCTLTQTAERRAALIPLGDNEHDDKSAASAERRRQAKFLRGDVGEECRMFLEQTAAVIQHKVLQELERLEETDVEVAEGDEADLTANQRLALEYRRRCRAVLENTLEAMDADMGGMDEGD